MITTLYSVSCSYWTVLYLYWPRDRFNVEDGDAFNLSRGTSNSHLASSRINVVHNSHRRRKSAKCGLSIVRCRGSQRRESWQVKYRGKGHEDDGNNNWVSVGQTLVIFAKYGVIYLLEIFLKNVQKRFRNASSSNSDNEQYNIAGIKSLHNRTHELLIVYFTQFVSLNQRFVHEWGTQSVSDCVTHEANVVCFKVLHWYGSVFI